MKTLSEFRYFAPRTLSEAASLLAKHKSSAKIIAGGTDVVPLIKDRVLVPRYVIDIKRILSLDYINWDDKKGLSIGALTKISTVAASDVVRKRLACLHQAAELLGTVQVRNMATIGGNICRSSPSADTVPPLLVLDAQVRLVGSDSERTVPLEDFITGPGENLLKNEILVEITIPADKRPHTTAFKKVGRTSEDLAKVNCAVKIVTKEGKCEEIRIALGAVSPTPIRAKSVEEALKGKVLSKQIVDSAVELVRKDCCPITDVRSNAVYRRDLSKILIKRLIQEMTSIWREDSND